ncbi:unnamed protein product [Adineta ricciae]|uniref:Uncharacterized protein n=1 Tax=Adineta ricciae TaxID=249248 RepID=A0A814TRA9_ADIRI|nr:unnamed protein product [Adineta ricciae]CAF1165826.1 unnamed protein product [Adineta ricciae]
MTHGDNSIARMFRSNTTIQQSTCSIISQFCDLQQRFLNDIKSVCDQLQTLKDLIDVLLNTNKVTTLKQYKIENRIEVIVCGAKSSGKASVIHELLRCGQFLPADINSISQRNVKFSYAASNKACLILHETNGQTVSSTNRIDLSSFFKTRIASEELKATLAPYLLQGEHTIESDDWKASLVELCLPSNFLQSNIDVYEISTITAIKNIHLTNPYFLFVYEGATISDETKTYYEQLRRTLGNTVHDNIFFLNTEIDLDDDRERNRRYENLRDVLTMNNRLPRTCDECNCFDVFSSEHPQQNVIDRILRFIFDSALRNTQEVSKIMLDTIDTFFDFVLMTNQRSARKWDRLREEALHWATEFFQQYRLQADAIGDEAQKQFSVRLRQQRIQLAKKIVAYRRERSEHLDLQVSSISLINAIQPIRISDDKNFSHSIVQEEIVRPVLSKIFNQINDRVSTHIDQNLVEKRPIKHNELILAAYRAFLDRIKIIDTTKRRDYFKKQSFKEILVGISGLMNTLGTLFSIKELDIDSLGEHIIEEDVERSFVDIGESIKRNIRDEVESNERFVKQKIHAYHQAALATANVRQQAYRLARFFAPQFARLECLLLANLDLAKHYGRAPRIDLGDTLGRGGFFSVHPASWDTERDLVAKVLLNSSKSPDFAYMEAHFHRTITRLNIEHIVPLHSLHYDNQNDRLYILLRRYPMSLHTYLTNHMADLTMSDAMRILLHISRAIAHLHAQNLIHRDIKTQNILLDDHRNVFLADFGTCQHGTENYTIIGSQPLPPEFHRDRRSIDFSYTGTAVDVFSLGVLMYALAPKAVYQSSHDIITEANIRELTHVPERYRSLIVACLHPNANTRPTAAQAVDQLTMIAEQVAKGKECLMCFEYPIFSRCLPCGHKTVCGKCFVILQQRATTRNQPKCIICQQAIANTREDTDNATFVEILSSF